MTWLRISGKIITGFYYLKTRYYDPELGRFISQDSIEYADPETINGLNLYAYCANNPVMYFDPTGNSWKSFWNKVGKWIVSGLEIVVGSILVVTGVGAGFGATLIMGGALGIVSNVLGSEIGGGIGSMINGWGAFSTGMSLLSFGPAGIIAGIGLMTVGGATMAMGANEVVSGITGTNYLRNWLGDNLYSSLYFGFNIASSVGTIVGRLGMRLANTRLSNRANLTEKPYAKIKTDKNIYYYDGKGRPYWSVHDIGTPNRHWHTSLGRDGDHIHNFFTFILKFIFRKW